MKRVIAILTLISVLFCTPFFCYAEDAVSINAPSAILVEKTTGKVMYEKDADNRMRPASVTKIMTLLLIVEAIESGQYGYSDTVTVSANATSMGGSQVYLKEGEKFTVEEMIKCIAVASANDCCVAMAEHTAGSEEAFVERMNERAAELEMTNTEFKNCTGLDAEGHLTTARDISAMSRELLSHEDIKRFTCIWTDSIREGTFGLSNTNKLIRFYDGATGLKTGYTSLSGYCMSASAMRNGMELIAVVMAGKTSSERNEDAKALLNYGFGAYELFTPEFPKLTPIKIIKGKEKQLTPSSDTLTGIVVKKGDSKLAKYSTNICKDVKAPVEKGQKLGEFSVTVNGEEVYKNNIVSPDFYEKAGIIDIFLQILHYFLIV